MRKRIIAAYFFAFLFVFSFCFCKVMGMDKKEKNMKLPAPSFKSGTSVEEAILKRRSMRSFSNTRLNWQQIGQLLWAGQGITAKKGNFPFRAAPSAGALYPMETFVVMEKGIYQYLPQNHEIRNIASGDKRMELSKAAFGQSFIDQAPVTIALCAVYSRITGKYGKRGIRYAHIEAGHIAQNIHLQAISLGLVSVPVGAFDDKATAGILNLPDDCVPLYLLPLGFPQKGKESQ